jgi:lipopolysaccharide export system permease protein
MKILDRYLGIATFFGIIIVLFVLTALFTFFTFIEEMKDIGKNDYGLIQAIQYVLSLTPRLIYDLFPTSVLLGTLLGLGALANNNELTVIRASGVSILRITVATLQVSLILTMLVMLIGETIAPNLEQQAREARANNQSGQPGQMLAFAQRWRGFWGQEETSSGYDFINIQRMSIDDWFADISLYRFDAQKQLQSIIYARNAQYEAQHKRWRFYQAEQIQFTPLGVTKTNLAEYTWYANLNPELVKHLVVQAERLSSFGLYKYIQYLQRNNLHGQAREYELALWSRLSYPLISITMLFLAIPFIFGSLRQVAIGERILLGAFLGVGFYMLNKTVAYASLVYLWHPIPSAVLPPLLFIILAIYLMKRRF